MRNERDRMQVTYDAQNSASTSKGKPLNLWQLEKGEISWTTTEMDITDIKRNKGIKVSTSDHSSTIATIAVLIFSTIYWLLYVTEIVPIWNIFAYFTVNLAILILVSFKVDDIDDSEPQYEKNLDYLQYISVIVISVMLTDILFEVYWFSSWIKAENIFIAIISNVSVILVIILLNNVVYLWAANKRNKRMPVDPVGWRNWRAEGMPVRQALRKKSLRGARLLARNVSIMMIIFCVAALTWMTQQFYILASILKDAPEGLPHEQIGFAEAVYQAFTSLTTFEGQYGAASSFNMVFEMLFYNQTTGIMLALMVIGTFANIFVINMSKSSALQSATTMTVIGIPMIMIVSMFLGVIPPPSVFVKLFGAEAIASFVFTFAMLSVYIIFLSMMMVFSHAAEIFQPQDED